MIKRYWFILYPDDRFGAGNIGVSAYSKEEAHRLIIETFKQYHFEERIKNLDHHTESIENIDIRLLDQNHIIPNMGVVVRKGVWWPNLNH